VRRAQVSAEVTARRVQLVTVVLGALILILAVLAVPIGIAARKPFDGLALFGVLAAALGVADRPAPAGQPDRVAAGGIRRPAGVL